MSDDLDFDFFSEETEQTVVTPTRIGGLAGRVSAAGRLPRRLAVRRRRLAAAIAAGIVLLIVIVMVATAGSSSQAAADRSYLGRLSPIAADSHEVGTSLEQLFVRLRRGQVTNPLPQLAQLIGRARRDLAHVQQLKPPVAMRSEQEQAVMALDFRARGLQGLHDAIGLGQGSSDPTASTAPVAAQIDRLVTSDVIWHDLVWQPAVADLKNLGVKDATAPLSQFLTDLNVSSPQSISQLLQPQSAANTQTALTLGATGPAVRAWQTQLNRWLHTSGRTEVTVDGNFGAGTQAATQALQRAQGLTPDGAVGPATRRALTAALAPRS